MDNASPRAPYFTTYTAQIKAAANATHDLDQLARLLDSRFRIPGTSIRFGMDSVLGLVPGVGDAAGAALSLYIIARAHMLGAPPLLLARMGLNTAADAALGAIPLLGDLFDLGFKANLKNMRLLKQHLAKRERANLRPARD